jgi:hypothetical protein
MAMISKRNATPGVEDEPSKEEDQPDPKAALNAMFAKRNAPPESSETEADAGVGDAEEEPEPDPRAALMAMISKRNATSSEGPQDKADKTPRAANPITKSSMPAVEHPEETPDPRKALSATLKNQTDKESGELPPGLNNQSKSTELEKQPTPADSEPPLNRDPKYEKYFRMLKMVSMVCTYCFL